jgi:hypothetical protein
MFKVVDASEVVEFESIIDAMDYIQNGAGSEDAIIVTPSGRVINYTPSWL